MNDPTLLYVSDDPESVTSHGQLFAARVPAWRVVRFLFDHVNQSAVPLRIICAVANTANTNALFSLLGACAGPDSNGMKVGHAATLRFLKSKEFVKGGAVSRHVVAPGRAYMLADFVVPIRACVAGIYDIAADPGTQLELRAFACDPTHDAASVWSLLPQSAASQKQRRGVFDVAGSDAPTALSYTGAAINASIGLVPLSRDPTYDPYGGVDYKGDYGVLRRLDARISVPIARSVSLYQSADGGNATATFIVDGRVLESSQIAPGSLYKVATYDFPAAGTVTSAIITMAEINSSYPFKLTLAADDPAVANAGSAGSPVSQA